MTRLRAALVVAIAFAVLTGCVSIPTSGSVQSAPIDVDTDDVSSIALPERPQAGQSMSDILRGFVRAARGPQNDYAIAHEYLAPGTQWSGTDRVLVASSIGNPIEVDEDTLQLSVTVVAEVDQRGRYTKLPIATVQTLTFDFVQVDGENRIVTPPAGSVLTPNGFSDTFRSYSLYFFDPSFRYLVPEIHWFPTPRVADRIVSELVLGQGDWLQANVLQTVFPVGTTASAVLDAPGVEVSLNAEVRAESPATQLRMIQQLRASLTSISTVSAAEVEVTADGLALSPATEDAPPPTRLSVGVVIGGVDGRVGTLTAEGVEPLASIGTRADDLGVIAASLGRDRTSMAVLGSSGVSLLEASGESLLIDDRAGLIAPTLDPFGFAWSVPADQPGALLAMGADGIPHPLQLPADGTVVAIELSRDGTRLLIVVNGSDGSRLLVAGVQRDAAFAPVGLHTPFELIPAGPVVDVAWVDAERVAVLSREGELSRVQLLPIGGPEINLGTLEDGVSIVPVAASNLQEGVRVLAADGQVLRPTSVGGWTATGLTASFLGTQQ